MMKSEIGKQHDTKTVDGNLATIGIVPIGIPKLAGPGAISTIIIYASEHEALEHAILVSGVILTVAIIIYLIFQMALVMESFFGETATVVMSKVMGLIVASLGIEAIIHGIAGHFPDLTIIH
jgi:multiple antibiotic resistance protein